MTVYPEKRDGRLTGRFVAEVRVNRRPIKKAFATLAEASEWEDANRSAPGAAQAARSTEDPVFFVTMIDRFAQRIWGTSQWAEYAKAMALRIGEMMGGRSKKLRAITAADVEEVVEQLKLGGLSSSTVNRYLSVFHKAMKYAKKHQWIAAVTEIDWEDEDEGRIRVVTEDEEVQLLATLRMQDAPDVADFVIVAIDTGARRSEIMREENVIDGDWVRLWRTKNGKPRSVPLSPRAKEAWTRNDGFKAMTEARLRYHWNAARKTLGLALDEDFVLHACRHTRATRLIQRGVNLVVVQRWMGHRDIKTTLRYVHINDDDLLRAARVVFGLEPVAPDNQPGLETA